jgi:hypothetical protein
MAILERAQARLSTWKFFFKLAMGVHLGAGLLSIAFSIAATAIDATSFSWQVKALSTGAAILTAIVAFMRPYELASGYVGAWRVLDDAVGRYIAKDPEMTDIELNKVIAKGESIVAGTESKPSK